MTNVKILWIDDEIDSLKGHIYFLQEKGHDVQTASNGTDALDILQQSYFDIVFLDEKMPGLSGLETLSQIKSTTPGIPVVMITKSEEEEIMEQAIGAKIDDYLIKPVKPNQILISLKKNVEPKKLISQYTSSEYQAEFSKLSAEINETNSCEGWKEIYRKLVFWDMELDDSENNQMDEILSMQKNEANKEFFKFIKKNYKSWFQEKTSDTPLLSQNLFREKVVPLLDNKEQVVFIVIDNLRFDQWRILRPLINEHFKIVDEDLYYGILPSATHYARNTMFAGLMPSEIERLYPDYWVPEASSQGKNNYESQLLEMQLERLGHKTKFHFSKINSAQAGHKILENIPNILNNQLVVLVYNFIDMLSHSRTEMEMIRELASDESAFRSLAKSWFQHSNLKQLLKKLTGQNINVVITTDHGSIQVNNPVKVVGDKETTSNLRYKQGKNLDYNPKQIMAIKKPHEVYLPSSNISSTYIFAGGNDFMAYPNNYNYYVNYYKNSFQHGGISLEEMLIPIIQLG